MLTTSSLLPSFPFLSCVSASQRQGFCSYKGILLGLVAWVPAGGEVVGLPAGGEEEEAGGWGRPGGHQWQPARPMLHLHLNVEMEVPPISATAGCSARR